MEFDFKNFHRTFIVFVGVSIYKILGCFLLIVTDTFFTFLSHMYEKVLDLCTI